MLQSNKQYSDYENNGTQVLLLQLLLFVDQRSASEKQIRKIKACLESLQSDYSFKLDVIEVERQPDLVEHLKLVATPALVKVAPGPRQILAGSNLIKQLEKCWPQWQQEQDKFKLNSDNSPSVNDNISDISTVSSIEQQNYYAEKIRLQDEIFSLKQEKEKLVEQLRFKDQIMAMLAHDLRTPLTAASMAVETIERSKNGNIEPAKLKILQKKLFQHAKSQFGTMNRMISELLQNSQNINAKLQIKPNVLNLHSLCQEAIAQFEAKLVQKSMTLKQDIPQDIPCVYGDEELIRQLISNLLDNAIKYTPKEGKISLSVLHRTNQKVQVSICDTGPGIPPEKRELIFQDSFRLKRDREQEGYGLGLAMCHQIVCAHYGQIWVESSPEQGSCFQFTLLVYK